ncbi:MAG: YIP1 family protein [Roseovarius sp.]
MSVTADMLRGYVAPRVVMRKQLAAPAEDRALIYLLLACGLFFVARLPALSRQDHMMTDSPGFAALASGSFLGAVIFAPLVFYAIAALSHLVARALGGTGSWVGARLALFWSLLMVAPLVLLRGLTEAMTGPGAALSITGFAVGIAFLWLWMANLREAEFGARKG